MTNKDIIIEIEKNTGLKVIEDIYSINKFITLISPKGTKSIFIRTKTIYFLFIGDTTANHKLNLPQQPPNTKLPILSTTTSTF